MNTGKYVHTLSIMYKISPSSKLISSGYKRTQDSIKITTNLRDHFLKLHYSKRLFTANFRKLSSIEFFLTRSLPVELCNCTKLLRLERDL